MSTAKIVLIDSDPQSARNTIRPLIAVGYQVEVAADGLSGISAVARLNPDLVLLDTNLPEGQSIEICREIRGAAGGGNPPIVVLGASENWRNEAARAGADGYLIRPLSEDRLLEVCHSYFAKKVSAPPEALADITEEDIVQRIEELIPSGLSLAAVGAPKAQAKSNAATATPAAVAAPPRPAAPAVPAATAPPSKPTPPVAVAPAAATPKPTPPPVPIAPAPALPAKPRPLAAAAKPAAPAIAKKPVAAAPAHVPAMPAAIPSGPRLSRRAWIAIGAGSLVVAAVASMWPSGSETPTTSRVPAPRVPVIAQNVVPPKPRPAPTEVPSQTFPVPRTATPKPVEAPKPAVARTVPPAARPAPSVAERAPVVEPPPAVEHQAVRPAAATTTPTAKPAPDPTPVAAPTATAPAVPAPAAVAPPPAEPEPAPKPAPAAVPSSAPPVEIPKTDGPPSLVLSPALRYPASAGTREEVTVELSLLVNEAGKVTVVTFDMPAPEAFANEAERVARGRVYKPGVKNGAPVKMWVKDQIVFKP